MPSSGWPGRTDVDFGTLNRLNRHRDPGLPPWVTPMHPLSFPLSRNDSTGARTPSSASSVRSAKPSKPLSPKSPTSGRSRNWIGNLAGSRVDSRTKASALCSAAGDMPPPTRGGGKTDVPVRCGGLPGKLRWLAEIRLLALLLGLIGFASGALADGKVFRPPTAYPVELRIPDQRALLAWSNGVERLVIETRFTGPGTNFAWVVPLPSAPKIEAATRGLFPTLTHLLRPKVVHFPAMIVLFVAFCSSLIWILVTVRNETKMRWTDWAASVVLGLSLVASGDLGLMIFGPLSTAVTAYGTYRVRRRRESPAVILLLLFLMFTFGGMFIPALATAKAKGGSDSVEILDRQLAGVFEITTLTARDPSALRDWLNTNGYVLPKDVEPVIADYLRDGWVFVASKVRRNVSSTEAGSLHPLSFTFAAKEPVYPLRLTGVGNGNLEVDLFVFGPERAKAPGFKVRDCRQPKSPPSDPIERERWWRNSERLPLDHDALRDAAGNAAFVTRLQGTLTPEQMQQDAVIQWDGFGEVRDVRYSQLGATLTVFNWTGSALCLFFVGLASVARWRGVEPTCYAKAMAAAVILAAAATGIGYAQLEVVPVTLERRFARWVDFRNQQRAVRIALTDELSTNAPITVDAVREALRRGLPFALTNGLSRPPKLLIREEDSPYNYTLRQGSNGVEVLFYDDFGRVVVEPVIE